MPRVTLLGREGMPGGLPVGSSRLHERLFPYDLSVLLINLSHKYIYMLGPMSPSSESLVLGVVLGMQMSK